MTDLLDHLRRALGESYVVERELGGGGMSRVFLATETALKRQVVIKVMSPELTSDVMTARFTREFEVTALLQHPHIVPVLAAGVRDGLLYYVTPFIAGESLRHRMAREGPLPTADVARILAELSSALAYAHERGVVHRDIKPENILLSGGLSVLADFGIASVLGGGADSPSTTTGTGPRLTELGTSIGTFGYMSPEQAAGESNLDGRSDIYSLAIVGYEMLAGRPPFTAASPLAMMTAHLTQAPAPIDSLRPDTPDALATALHRALAKDPAARFATAAEFRDALGISFTGSRESARAPRRRRRTWMIGGAALAILIAAAMVIRPRGAKTLDANLIAIAPFEVLDPRLEMWREGMVDILSTNLDGAGPLRTVSPTMVVRRWSGRAEKASAKALGEKTGARITVFGQIVGAGADSIRLTASVFDVQANRVIGDISLRESESRVDRLADSLTVRILRELDQTRAIVSMREAPLGSSSLPAIKAYLQGEQWYRRSAWDSAAAYYRRAIDADTMFAPAYRRLSNALSWQLGQDASAARESYSYALIAGQRNHGLAARESLLVVADSLSAALQVRGNNRGDPYALARRLVSTLDEGARRFPTDPEIWHKLGDMRFHYLFFVPNGTYAQARDAFDRSIALDSAFAPSYSHMPFLALNAQDTAAARRYIKGYLALGTDGGYATSFRALDRLITTRDRPARVAMLDSLAHAGELVELETIAQSLVNWMDADEVILDVGRVADSASRADTHAPAAVRAQIAYALPMALATRGHLREAALAPDSTLWRLLPELAMLGAVPPERMDAVAMSWMTGPREGYFRIPLLYPWWALRGDTVRLLRSVDAMQRSFAQIPGAVTELATVRAYLALARRDTAAAIAAFATLPDSVCVTNWCYTNRLAKAQLLSARKMDREADRLLSQEFADASPGRVLWMLERGRVSERLSKRPEAVGAYGFVVDAWRHADPALQPAVREAESGLRRLGTDRPKAR